MALVSLIAGIVGLTLLPILGSIAAVITGYMARKEIRASAGAITGDGMAMAGLIMGWIGVVLSVVGLCIACLVLVALPAGIINAGSQYGAIVQGLFV
jgi:predicted house-cleaning NTP pyrophosphatase (Maf/HAM1 superfamily)